MFARYFFEYVINLSTFELSRIAGFDKFVMVSVLSLTKTKLAQLSTILLMLTTSYSARYDGTVVEPAA